MKIYIRSAEETNDEELNSMWDKIHQISDRLDEDNTYINPKVPSIFKKIKLQSGTLNLNYGKRQSTSGGFDVFAEYYESLGFVNITLDPFDASKAKDKEVIQIILHHGGTDTATCLNVLHSVDKATRQKMINNLRRLVKPGGRIYFIASGDFNHDGTDDDIDDFLDEIQSQFSNVKRANNQVIIAINTSKGSTGAIKTSSGTCGSLITI